MHARALLPLSRLASHSCLAGMAVSSTTVHSGYLGVIFLPWSFHWPLLFLEKPTLPCNKLHLLIYPIFSASHLTSFNKIPSTKELRDQTSEAAAGASDMRSRSFPTPRVHSSTPSTAAEHPVMSSILVRTPSEV